MKAGIDIGSTLTKVAWGLDGDKYQFASTADWDMDVLVTTLKDDGVTDVFLTGNGKSCIDWAAKGFRVVRSPHDRLLSEFVIQAEGTRRLLKRAKVDIENFLLVTVGTGTSYVHVSKDKVEPFPLGTGIGGGFIMGSAWPGHDASAIEFFAEDGRVQDLLVQDIIPDAQGLPGWATVAHFGKLRESFAGYRYKGDFSDEYATRMNMVAVLILRDVYLLSRIAGKSAPSLAVFSGSTITRFPTLRKMFEDCASKFRRLGLLPETVILEDGQYAGAVGAYHAIAG